MCLRDKVAHSTLDGLGAIRIPANNEAKFAPYNVC
jgi:hypothetical protein